MLVVVIVSLGVASGVRRIAAPRNVDHTGHRPRWKDHCVAIIVEFVDYFSTVTIDREAANTIPSALP